MTTDPDGLRAGSALLAAGRPAAARVAWARAGDDPLVVGLVHAAAALDHASRDDAAETRARAARARARLPADGPVGTGPLAAALADPAALDAGAPPRVPVEGAAVDPEALAPPALARAARAVAAVGPYDEAVVADAARFAWGDRGPRERRGGATGDGGRFGTLLTDVVVGREAGVAYARLRSLVERERARERDVDGLF